MVSTMGNVIASHLTKSINLKLSEHVSGDFKMVGGLPAPLPCPL